MLLIYLPSASSRTEYIFDTIFNHEYGLSFRVTSDVNYFLNYQEEKINYSNKRFQNELYIHASYLLAENCIEPKSISIGKKNNTIILFPNDESCDIGFDVFAAAFYMLSRYEEYLPFSPDKYGRYNALDSVAYKNNFLQIPIVDYWLIIFKEILQNKFFSLAFKETKFKSIVTYDIDVAYKFKGRSFKRNAGATVKDVLHLDFKNILHRYKTLFHENKDPWDTYDYLKKIITQNNLSSLFFFLLADNSINDRNLHYKNPEMIELITKIKTFSEIGIHPSFKSSALLEKIGEEKKRLEDISGGIIIRSRQHFLKFTLPETYNALIDAGIEEDYSMGFPYEPGFRAGTSKPFYFYDLKYEKLTGLKIFPITFMEGSFINSKLSHEKIVRVIAGLIKEVKNVEGTLISIWHNHTVSDTKEFKNLKYIHEWMIEAIVETNNFSK